MIKLPRKVKISLISSMNEELGTNLIKKQNNIVVKKLDSFYKTPK